MKISTRKNKEKKATRKGFIYLILALVSCIGLFTFIISNKPLKLDNKNCPQSGIEAKTVVLIDTSDPLTDIQRLKFNGPNGSLLKQFEDSSKNKIINELGLGKNHQLSVWVMNDLNNPPINKGRICNPGSINSGSFIEDAQKGALIRKAEFKKFRAILNNLFPKNLGDMNAKKSPILYSINYIITSEFGEIRKEYNSNKPNRLIIVSDMIENGKIVSHFKELPKNIELNNINLDQIVVIIKSLKRDQYKKIQINSHKLWWLNYFKKAGAYAVNWNDWY